MLLSLLRIPLPSKEHPIRAEDPYKGLTSRAKLSEYRAYCLVSTEPFIYPGNKSKQITLPFRCEVNARLTCMGIV